MKVYEYNYYIRYGSGQGIVIAESVEDAIQLLRGRYISDGKTIKEMFPDLEFTEIDITKPQLLDHSYEE